VPVAGLGVDQGDDPIRCGALGDHGGQQPRGLGGVGAELGAAQREQCAVAIPEQAVDQLLAGGGIVPVTGRLAWGGVVVVALPPGADLGGQLAR
jgi:hypothetical protein